MKTLGCKVNRTESDTIAAELLGYGAVVVDEGDAEVVIVNTCTVTGEADAKARKAVRRALAGPRAPVVVVTGCLAALDAATLAALDRRVVVESDKTLVSGRVCKLLGLDASSAPVARPGGGRSRTRAALKIEDGCDAFCSYCVVPHARGGPRGVAMSHVVDEARRLVAAGVNEIVLTGINVGRYRDVVSGNDLGGLIEAVAATGVKRLRLSSIEPRDLTPGFLDAVAHTPTFCPHLHVPLQSGCDQILSAMNRGYTSDEYRQFVADARDAVPGLALTTDVIVGFPGESDGQAGETRDFCESIGFRRMHVFRYSRRANTPAAARVDQVTPAAKSARAAQLRGLSSRLWIRDVEGCLGQLRELLVERLGEDGTRGCVIEGTTRDYLRVRVRIDQEPGSAAPDVGSLAAVRLTRIEGERVGAVLMS